MAKRHYSVRWSYDDTVSFIKARTKLNHIFVKKIYDLRSSWEKVAAEAGIDEDWSKLRKKWANIMTRYKSIVDPPTGIGNEDDGPGPLIWPYFELLHEFTSARHNINPLDLFDTALPPEVRSSDYEDSTSCSEESASLEGSRSLACSTSSVASSSRSVACSSRNVAFASRTVLSSSRDEDAKIMRDAAKVFVKYMRLKHNITADDTSEKEEEEY